MRNLLIILFFVSAACASLPLRAQDQLLKKADTWFKEGNYPSAIKAYTKYIKNNPGRKKPVVNLAHSYQMTFQYALAAEWYEKALAFPRPEPILHYNYGQTLMNLQRYQEAQQWFLKFAELNPEDPRGMAMAGACTQVDAFRKDSAYYAVLPLPINTKESEFAPSFWGDGIVFTASRQQTTLDANDYDWTSENLFDLYYTKITPDGNGFSRPRALDGSVNTPYHEATATFDREGKTVYFTRNNTNPAASGDALNQLQIYYADLDNGEWSDIRGLPFNSNKYSVGHPSLSRQGNILYFVSDMPGGYGGTDIYLTYRREDAWSAPVNLGPVINSAGNEMFPFIHEDRTLYFSSDGHAGLGGLDLFSAEFDTIWRSVRNLGYPFNTSADDFALIISDEKDKGFFSSNRPGGKGLDDLYRFSVLRPLLSGVVIRDDNGQPLADVKITVQVSGTESRDVLYTSAEGRFSQLLHYDEDYRIFAEKQGYIGEVAYVSTLKLSGPERQEVSLFLKPAPHRIQGTLIEPTSGDPIIDAQVRLLGENGAVRTDSAGHFEFFIDPKSKPGYTQYEPDEDDCREVTISTLCYHFTPAVPSPPAPEGMFYVWTFGEAGTETGQEVNHCFDKPGNYRVRLVLQDAAGNVKEEKLSYNFNIPDASQVSFRTARKVERQSLATFDATGSRLPGCVITDFFWSFGDGATAYGEQVVHLYPYAGTYKVKLEVTGRGLEPGQFCQACVYQTVTVSPKAEDITDPEPVKVVEQVSSVQGCSEDINLGYCYSFFDAAHTGRSGDTLFVWDFSDGETSTGARVVHCFQGPGRYFVRLQLRDAATQLDSLGESSFEILVQDTGAISISAPLRLAAGLPVTFTEKVAFPPSSESDTEWDLGDGSTAIGTTVEHTYATDGDYIVSYHKRSRLNPADDTCMVQRVRVQPAIHGREIPGLSSSNPDAFDPSKIYYLEITKGGYITQIIPLTQEVISSNAPIEAGASLDPDYILLEGTVMDDSLSYLLHDAVVRVRNVTTGRMQTLVTGQTGAFSAFLDPEMNYEVSAEKGNYLSSSVLISTADWSQNMRRINERIRLKKINFSESIVLKNIYYEFAKWNLLPSSIGELDKLVRFMQQNSGISIEVAAHTDSRGSDEYNLLLSQNRAHEVSAYLVHAGIDSNRVSSVGYGEQKPVNECVNGVDCPPERHKENRRTEFRVTGSVDPYFTEATAEGISVKLDIARETVLSDTGVLYSVQVGLFRSPDLQKIQKQLGSYYRDLRVENVNGLSRFRVGAYPTFEAAKLNLAPIAERGFPDAFIAAVPAAELSGRTTTAKPVVSYEPVRSGSATDVKITSSNTVIKEPGVPGLVYKVHIGTFSSEPPAGYFEPLEIWRSKLSAELADNSKRYMIGPFTTLASATAAVGDLKKKGFAESAVVAYYKYRRITTEEALRMESAPR